LTIQTSRTPGIGNMRLVRLRPAIWLLTAPDHTGPHLTAPDHLEHHKGPHRTIWSIFRITNDPCSSIGTLLATPQFVPYIILHLFTLYYLMTSWLCGSLLEVFFVLCLLFFVSYW